MKKFIALIAAALLWVGAADGQAIVQTVRGKVFDIETQATIPGANISIAGTAQGTASSADGTFRIANVPVGRHDLIASLRLFMQLCLQNDNVNFADNGRERKSSELQLRGF